MKKLAILLLLISGITEAQTKKSDDSISESSYPSLFKFGYMKSFDFEKKLTLLPKYASYSSTFFTTSPRLIVPNNANIFSYPTSDLGNLNAPFLGTTSSNSFQLGNQKFRSTYVFDINGAMRNYQLSFPLGKKK